MSTDGENILKVIKQTRSICEQISLLLRTVDEQMKKAGWDSEGNTAIAESSSSIQQPAQWLPSEVFRFYRHKDYPNRLAYVSILLDDDKWKEYTIKEPLVTAGFFDYGQVKVGEQGDNWLYWYARYYGYLAKDKGLSPDGQHFHFDPRTARTGDWGEFESAEVFALPLTSITNADDAKSKITDKLLELVKEEK